MNSVRAYTERFSEEQAYRKATGLSRSLETDIRRFLKLTDVQLEYALSAWCQYRAADGDLVELIVDHVEQMNTHDKRPYFEAMAERYEWVAAYPHHVKAITLASCKYNLTNHPDLVRFLLNTNSHITREVLMQTLGEGEASRSTDAACCVPTEENDKSNES